MSGTEPTEKHREAARDSWREWVAAADEDSTLMGPEFIEHLALALAAAEEAGLERAAQLNCHGCASGFPEVTLAGVSGVWHEHPATGLHRCESAALQAAIRRLKGDPCQLARPTSAKG